MCLHWGEACRFQQVNSRWMIRLTVEYAIRNRPANVWYKSPEARNLQVGKQELIMHCVAYFLYFSVVLSCQSVLYGPLRISLGRILDAIVSQLKKVDKI